MTWKLAPGSALEGSGGGWGTCSDAGSGSGTTDRMFCRKLMAHRIG